MDKEKLNEHFKKSLETIQPDNPTHFQNGYNMYPNDWELSTKSWRQGYEAREQYEKEIKVEEQQ